MALHDHIDAADLNENGLLLSDEELKLVVKIKEFMQSVSERALPVQKNLRSVDQELEQVSNQMELLNDPRATIDAMLVELMKENEHDPHQFIVGMAAKLNELSLEINEKSLSDFINDMLIKIPDSSDNDVFDLYETMTQNMEDVFELYEEQFPAHLTYSKLEKHREFLYLKKKSLTENIERLTVEVDDYKSQMKVDFELNENYEISKISKRSEGINFSVVFANNTAHNASDPYALYRGKDKILGKGGFGELKLCQNLVTGEWHAIKIQQAIMRQPSQKENKVLNALNRYQGELSRDKKYYSIQTLINGIDLKKYLSSSQEEDLSTRLVIVKQAINLLSDFHRQHYIHRDIKPENFIWDANNQQLYLCDFGLSCSTDHDGTFVDLSGSGTPDYLAPEIDDQRNSGHVPYSTKSDIFALGKTIDDLLKDVAVSNEMSMVIEKMTAQNLNERTDNLQELVSVVDAELKKSLESSPYQNKY